VPQGLENQLAVLRSRGTGMRQVIQIINHPGLPHVPRPRLFRQKN
jgi:hypothetical protein